MDRDVLKEPINLENMEAKKRGKGKKRKRQDRETLPKCQSYMKRINEIIQEREESLKVKALVQGE